MSETMNKCSSPHEHKKQHPKFTRATHTYAYNLILLCLKPFEREADHKLSEERMQ